MSSTLADGVVQLVVHLGVVVEQLADGVVVLFSFAVSL